MSFDFGGWGGLGLLGFGVSSEPILLSCSCIVAYVSTLRFVPFGALIYARRRGTNPGRSCFEGLLEGPEAP